MSAKPQACIFDLDGVIVDTARYHFSAWSELAEELVIPFNEEDNEQLKGLSRIDSLEHILRKGSLVLDNHTKVRLMDRKNDRYLSHVKTMTPAELFPGVLEFIDELRAEGIRIGLGSSSRNAPLILDLCCITDRFETVVDGNSITLSKPDPEVFLTGALALGAQPENTVVFEDAVSGVQAGKAGGFRVVGVGSPEVLSEADFTISSFEGFSLQELLSRLS